MPHVISFRVDSGFDSAILGDVQVLAQIRRAFSVCVDLDPDEVERVLARFACSMGRNFLSLRATHQMDGQEKE